MSFTKSNIVKNIAKKTSISQQSAKLLLNKFIKVIISGSYKGNVKLSSFGTFERKKTPARIGRNPKTGLEFNISERTKLNLSPSNLIKKKIN